MSTVLTPPTHLSRWRRSRKKAILRLEGGVLTLRQGDDGAWRVEPPVCGAVASGLEGAIREVEAHLTLAPWVRTAAGKEIVWSAGPWRIVDDGMGARVFRGEEQMTKAVFRNADGGRAWAESRFQRTETSLFGRECRADSKALFSLPIVRVTASERDEAREFLAHHGITYSEFVRAAVRYLAQSSSVRVSRVAGQVQFVSE